MIRRFFTRILMLVLIAACAYNGVQTVKLQRQVRSLEAALHTKRVGKLPAPQNDTWLTRANTHAAKASDELTHGNFPGAQRDLERGTEDIRRAAKDPAAHAASSMRELTRQMTILQARAQSLQARTGPEVRMLQAQARAFTAGAQALLHHE